MRSRARYLAALAAVATAWLGAQALGDAARSERTRWPSSEAYPTSLVAAQLIQAIGYNHVAADLSWAWTLVYYGSSLVGEADYEYLERGVDTVIELDPKFERVYLWAARAVTFQNETATQEEYRISVRYLERGIEEFPDRYELYWTAGIHYFLDLYSDDPEERRRYRERGADLIEQAMRKKDAPADLATFAASLRMKLGQKERALHDLREMILTTESEEAQQVLIRRYNNIASAAFPEEAQRAKREFEASWRSQLPFASPSMYVLLGDRPSPVIEFDELATERDLFGARPTTGMDTGTETETDTDAGTDTGTATGTRTTGESDRESAPGARP